mmetsp:Transcript_57206/g.162415  ORF Transcript_57206/g.162415 Transcript_57206/m.162415 type:complete len:223 (+) Transcript_57206:2832-3500(+)
MTASSLSMAHLSSFSAMGIRGGSYCTPWPDSRPWFCRKQLSAKVFPPGTLCLCHIMSARRTTIMPASVCTRWTFPSSSKGDSSSVPWPGPRKRTSMSLCQMKTLSHLMTLSCCTSGGSCCSIPASLSSPGVLPKTSTPMSFRPCAPPTTPAMPESASSSFLSAAHGSSSVPSSAKRMEPSSPSSPSMTMAGVGSSRPLMPISLISCRASCSSWARPLVLTVQ